MCTSSIIYTFTFDLVGAKFIFSFKSRTSSIPRFEAASISIKSISLPSPISLHNSHDPHGSKPSFRLVQFSALAKSLAVEVFPVPRGPVNK